MDAYMWFCSYNYFKNNIMQYVVPFRETNRLMTNLFLLCVRVLEILGIFHPLWKSPTKAVVVHDMAPTICLHMYYGPETMRICDTLLNNWGTALVNCIHRPRPGDGQWPACCIMGCSSRQSIGSVTVVLVHDDRRWLANDRVSDRAASQRLKCSFVPDPIVSSLIGTAAIRAERGTRSGGIDRVFL